MSNDRPFVIEPEELLLELTGEFDGAVLRVVGEISLQDYFDLQNLVAPEDADNEEKMLRFAEGVRRWADNVLIDWNIERPRGRRLEANGDNLLRLPPPLINAIMRTWMEAVQKPAPPLAAPSPNGDTSETQLTKTGTKSGRRRSTRSTGF